MKFSPGDMLHVYNRGNNKQQIFFSEDNYRFFLHKAQKEIASTSDVLAYCLMPNHYHFLIHVNESSCIPKKLGSLVSTQLQNGFRVLQSSYAHAINRQLSQTGSIFQQKSKYKLLSDGNSQSYQGTYAEVCFNYIHQNPLKAGLVKKIEDWKYSSFSEYMDVAKENTICNKDLALECLKLDIQRFYQTSQEAIRPELIDEIFHRGGKIGS